MAKLNEEPQTVSTLRDPAESNQNERDPNRQRKMDNVKLRYRKKMTTKMKQLTVCHLKCHHPFGF
jgi:hypothetical protein